MTLAIPEELHKIVKKHDEIKWSEVARKAMWAYAKKVEAMDKIIKKRIRDIETGKVKGKTEDDLDRYLLQRGIKVE